MTLHSIVIQKLLSTNAHLGRRVAEHHFKLYTYGLRNGMAIIDSDKTLICMRNACHFIGSLVRQKGRFMFVNTNPLFDEIIEQMTKKIGCYSPSASIMWRQGGFLTNSNSPKKFRSRNKKICFTPAQPPDCMVVFDTERKSSVIFEADKRQIPVVALVNSSMPWDCFKRIAYPVPANDSVQFVYLFCNMITKTFILEQRKLATAKGLDDEDLALKPKKGEETKRLEESEAKADALKEQQIVAYESLAPTTDDIAEEILDKLIILKFNRSLVAKMDPDAPKSWGTGLASVDAIANQLQLFSSKYGCNIPLHLINLVENQDNTLKLLEKYSNLDIEAHTYNQSQLLQLSSSGVQPSKDELSSSGYGAMFVSLMKSGFLDVLLMKRKEYLLVIDSDDNDVAAVVDPKTLNYLVQSKIDCCMEVMPTASSDWTGNILNSRQGKAQLMEKIKHVDSRSLWVSLKAIKTLVDTDSLETGSFSVDRVPLFIIHQGMQV